MVKQQAEKKKKTDHNEVRDWRNAVTELKYASGAMNSKTCTTENLNSSCRGQKGENFQASKKAWKLVFNRHLCVPKENTGKIWIKIHN